MLIDGSVFSVIASHLISIVFLCAMKHTRLRTKFMLKYLVNCAKKRIENIVFSEKGAGCQRFLMFLVSFIEFIS